ncbi:MAG TPA: hypothetical protein VEY89_05410 [Candidatus Dormibacteraeota bacterium]|nr:hypothetical protein [Candidatus Dormibacteraeota bacterium]
MARWMWSLAVLACLAAAACGSSSGPADDGVSVSPQNTTLLVGLNRVSIALLDQQQNPVHATAVHMQVVNAQGRAIDSVTMHGIGPEYGGIPVYVGVATFPDVGQFQYVVNATGAGGRQLAGQAYVTVMLKGSSVPVGAATPALHQAVLGDPGVTLASIDSGNPPDDWHSATIAQGLAQHRPMVLYFGDPAYCPSKTCGPTHQILEQLCAQYCGQLLFEHIETYYPAGPPGPQAHVNPAFSAFGLQTDPWIYFVNAAGVIADRYEGPVTLSDLVQSARGTLAGAVPAVALG